MHVSPSRQERMAALALAQPESLVDAVAQLPPLPPYSLPRRPEAGMIMARARTGNTGQIFHMGEVLVTRCTVCLEESQDPGGAIMGHAWGGAGHHAMPSWPRFLMRCGSMRILPRYWTRPSGRALFVSARNVLPGRLLL